MREFDRIDRITNLLNKAWKKHPDLRFFQFLDLFRLECSTDPFYAEDDKVEEWLERFIEFNEEIEEINRLSKWNKGLQELQNWEEED